MKCPVCNRENRSMLCPECSFDASRDYGQYPVLAPVENMQAVSALQQEWEQKQRAAETAFFKPDLSPTPISKQKSHKKLPWIIVLVCVASIAVGIWIGAGIRGTGTKNWRDNLLQSDFVLYDSENPEDWAYEAMVYPVFGSQYQRWQIASVTFLDTLENRPTDAWDVSAYGDGSVMAWTKPRGEMYDLYIGAEGGVNGAEACLGLFEGYGNMERIHFYDAFHTEGATDMACMFSGCSALKTLDLSCLDTSNVQDMFSMFAECWMLTELDLSGFDTAKVQDMSFMFSGCEELRELDLSGFDTARVEDMMFMFTWCYALESLDLSSFNTARVQDMSFMFGDCTQLQSLDLSSFDTSNVLDTTDIFQNCPAGADWQHLLK